MFQVVNRKNRSIHKGGHYLHFKGKFVEVLGFASSTDDPDRILVLYREFAKSNFDTGCIEHISYEETERIWARPVSEFVSEVDTWKYPNSIFKYRFTHISDDFLRSRLEATKTESKGKSYVRKVFENADQNVSCQTDVNGTT